MWTEVVCWLNLHYQFNSQLRTLRALKCLLCLPRDRLWHTMLLLFTPMDQSHPIDLASEFPFPRLVPAIRLFKQDFSFLGLKSIYHKHVLQISIQRTFSGKISPHLNWQQYLPDMSNQFLLWIRNLCSTENVGLHHGVRYILNSWTLQLLIKI